MTTRPLACCLALLLSLTGCDRGQRLIAAGRANMSYRIGFAEPVDMDTAAEALRVRLMRAGVRSVTISRLDSGELGLILRNVSSVDLLKSLLLIQGRFRAVLVDESSTLFADAFSHLPSALVGAMRLEQQPSLSATLRSPDAARLRSVAASIAAGAVLKGRSIGLRSDSGDAEAYVLLDSLIVSNGDVANAVADSEEFEGGVRIGLYPPAARRLAQVTGSHVGGRMALLLDDRVLVAPIVRSVVSDGRVYISLWSGAHAGDRVLLARVVALLLASPALPARPVLMSENVVGGP